MKPNFYKIIVMAAIFGLVFPFFFQSARAQQAQFNPQYILSDEEMQSTANWSRDDVQKFLESKGGYLAGFSAEDLDGVIKPAADIIFEAAARYRINPKYILVTLQKEQSLVTDDSPTQKQLDWATGYGVCDGCYLSDPNVLKHKGFGKQVDNSAGVIRWYYDNSDKSYVKKKDQVTIIDSETVIPQTWATAFLYTYTPHFHGNKNFWAIWNTWFSQIYPNGTLLASASSSEVWLIQNNIKRKFKNKATLLSRANPDMIITVNEVELSNYQPGTEISFPNYSLLKAGANYYLLDYDTLRPFASSDVVRQLGYNPDEIIEVAESDVAGYPPGKIISSSSTTPRGIIYQITDLKNALYLFKDETLYPIVDKAVVEINYKDLALEKHTLKDIKNIAVADVPLTFNDGTLLKAESGDVYFVIENGKKRRISDEDTFLALGYKKSNIKTVKESTLIGVLEGEPLFVNTSLLSSKEKFLGDSEMPVDDVFGIKKSASYLVAEYPSGRILSGKNIDQKRPIASLTKLLVAYEALNQNFDLKKSTVYDSKKQAASGKNLSLKNGAKLKNQDLFTAMLVDSSNNMARMVAQASGLSESRLIGKINTRLDKWGADNSKIADVMGLDKKNVSTARDLLKIFTKVLDNKTIKEALFITQYSFKELPGKVGAKSHSIKNTNGVISMAGRNYLVKAGKTGFTDEAQAVLGMLIESKVTKKQYIVITLGNPDYNNRFKEPNDIAKWISTGKVKIANN